MSASLWVDRVFELPLQGPVVCVTYHQERLPFPYVTRVRRVGTFERWLVRSVGRFMLEGTKRIWSSALYERSWFKRPIGLLLPAGAPIQTGDWITLEDA